MKNFDKFMQAVRGSNTKKSLMCLAYSLRTSAVSCNHKDGLTCAECHRQSFEWMDTEIGENDVFPKLSVAEYELLKELHKDGYNYIARDSNKSFVTFYKEKPIKDFDIDSTSWYTDDLRWFDFEGFPNFFRFVRWEDEVPLPIDKLIQYYEAVHNA